jgi:hypothetical protein
MAQKPLVVQGFLIIEALQSHTDTPQSVGLLWINDQPETDISSCQNTALTRDGYPCPRGIGTSKRSMRAIAALRIKPREYWEFLANYYFKTNNTLILKERFAKKLVGIKMQFVLYKEGNCNCILCNTLIG